MILPRRHYLAIAGVEVPMFKALQRRGQLPLMGAGLKSLIPNASAADLDDSDSAGYSAEEAMMLAIANHMVEQNSFSRSSAAQIVSGYWNVLPDAVRRAEAGEEVWYAVLSWDFGHDKQADEEGNKGHWSWVEAGSFDQVINAIREERSTVEREGGRVDNVAMFDLSLIVQRARIRATGLNFEIGPFFPSYETAGSDAGVSEGREAE